MCVKREVFQIMTEQTRPLKKSDLTLHVITKPLRDALRDARINEDSVMHQLASILYKDAARDADKIRIAELFVKWLGVIENVNINVGDLDAALAELEGKRRTRKKKTDTEES